MTMDRPLSPSQHLHPGSRQRPASFPVLSRLGVLPLLLLVLTGLSGCGSGPRTTTSRTGEQDEMTVTRTDRGWAVALNDRECLTFTPPELPGAGSPEVTVRVAGEGWQRVGLRWQVPGEIACDELAIPFEVALEPDFWWAPHLAPEEGYVIAQHVFRSPALIAQQENLSVAVVPDLDLVGQRPDSPWFLDYDAPARRMWLGLVRTDIPAHVLFTKTEGMTIAPGELELAFYVCTWKDDWGVRNPWAPVASFLWRRWGSPLLAAGEPIGAPLATYVDRTYEWAFGSWAESVWQEFDLEGVLVGAPQFIVNISQSPNYPGIWYQREFLSIWNQTWFSSLRSASGLYRRARKTGDDDLLRRARLTRELALAAPVSGGLFPAVIRTPNETVEIEGREYRRPRPWSEATWSNSNRCPRDHGITDAWYHVLDSSWTALLMLRWYDELEAEERLLDYARAWGERLLTLQDEAGFFPGWLDPETHEPGPVMNRTPETSLSVTFLLALAEATGQTRYREAALRAMQAVLAAIVPEGKWHDYETFWSCCGWGREEYLDRKIERNALHKQNTLSMFWTAEALLACFRATGEQHYLAFGWRTLDELSMAQQVWQPPFIYVPALGGFGVMNADGEWNDSRQTLFAELFLDYYRWTGDPAHFERGLAALKAGFVMMYCPENPGVQAMWEKVYPWFGPEDYGFTMENYGHGGRTSAEGEGMGVFTIYDWGNGAAAEAAMRILDHWGQVYIDRERERGFGIDRVQVRKKGRRWVLINQAPAPRTLRIVYEDGSEQSVEIDDRIVIRPPER